MWAICPHAGPTKVSHYNATLDLVAKLQWLVDKDPVPCLECRPSAGTHSTESTARPLQEVPPPPFSKATLRGPFAGQFVAAPLAPYL
mmetsp:Transcript_1129/g.1679  ORF Transcript_1129/g.1679 Transcript_1129/m.1679 type:complete len:87 (+) Transcript_1129:87-347(+)